MTGKKLIPAFFLLLNVNFLFAQAPQDHNVRFSIPNIAFLDIEAGDSSRTIDLGVAEPDDAGQIVIREPLRDRSLWLNYTSIVNQHTEQERQVMAQITD